MYVVWRLREREGKEEETERKKEGVRERKFIKGCL